MRELSINNMIEKEFVPFLTFESEDVISEDHLKIQRTILLHTAMLLGNCFKDKVTIVFKTQEGINEVKTTVWAATEESIVLKGGTVIPVRSIMDVKIL